MKTVTFYIDSTLSAAWNTEWNPNYSSSSKTRDQITKLDYMTHQYLLNQLIAKTKSITKTGQDSFFWQCFVKIFPPLLFTLGTQQRVSAQNYYTNYFYFLNGNQLCLFHSTLIHQIVYNRARIEHILHKVGTIIKKLY